MWRVHARWHLVTPAAYAGQQRDRVARAGEDGCGQEQGDQRGGEVGSHGGQHERGGEEERCGPDSAALVEKTCNAHTLSR
ncbi:MAG: hypothetical protein ACRDZ4_17765 [Egibacteraceae bacterium]